MTADADTPTPAKTRRQRRAPGGGQGATADSGNQPSKLQRIVAMLSRPDGASLAELVAATGWRAHSVRGALAGSLKKKGHVILSAKHDGERRYRIGVEA